MNEISAFLFKANFSESGRKGIVSQHFETSSGSTNGSTGLFFFWKFFWTPHPRYQCL